MSEGVEIIAHFTKSDDGKYDTTVYRNYELYDPEAHGLDDIPPGDTLTEAVTNFANWMNEEIL